jgi:hypothetical protein
MAEPWRRLLRSAASALQWHPEWGPLLFRAVSSNRGLHLVVLGRQELDEALFGITELTVRSTTTPALPFGCLGRLDLLFLKYRGGPIAGITQLTRVWSYEALNSTDARALHATLSARIHDSSLSARQLTGKHVSVVRLGKMITIPRGIDYPKSGRDSWLVLRRPSRPLTARRYLAPTDLRGLQKRRRASRIDSATVGTT